MLNKKKAVLVFGPPKSGTSLTAGICSHLGVNFGNNLKPGNKTTNPLGYYEDADFDEYVINNGIKNVPPLDKTISRLSRPSLWGLKNPQIPFVYEELRPLLKDQDVVFVMTTRDREANIASIRKNIIKFSEGGAEMILDGFTQAIKLTDDTEQHSRCVEISFENWFSRPQEQMYQLCQALEVPATKEAYDFIKQELKHF